VNLAVDFHVHSKYSFDCFLDPAQLIARAKACGLGGLVVTDHDTMAGVEEFRRCAAKDFLIIAGEEISTRQGDVLGVFLKEPVAPHPQATVVVERIRRQGGLAILAHPYKWPHCFRDAEFLKEFDAIEVFNARNNMPLPYLENALARRALQHFPVAFVAGSDTHDGAELGLARTRFPFSLQDASEEKIRRAVLDRCVQVQGREFSYFREFISHFSRLGKTISVRRRHEPFR
jgi:hypothetical protein